MSKLTFTATMEIRGINPYVLVTQEQAAQLQPNWRKPMPVLITINQKPDEPWPINMMPVGDGSFYLYLNEIPRRASGTKVGDTVTIEVEFDASYQNGPQHEMPSWFAEALTANAAATANWEALSPSRQKEVLRYFAGLKTNEAKIRNTEKAIHVLSGNPGRFMGREWHNGS